MTEQAKGTFEVRMTPAAHDPKESLASARFTVAKEFQGDLVGTSRGEMWTADGIVEGSAGYVAIERVDGSLHGRRGAFALLHQGTMRRGGEFRLSVIVVPDSGTDELAGIAGTMSILVAKGSHSYELEYSLPDST
jgi:hypothetical protein